MSCAASSRAEVLVQDIAHLQGEHVNRLMGYGLIVGLNGTGDGGKNPRTLRALAALHQRYEQNVLALEELEGDKNVAMVIVEVETPPHGWRSGQRLDVTVSALGAKSLIGGQLLTTPLQVAPLPKDAPPELARIWALAGGKLEIDAAGVPTRGLIRNGAIMEADHYHSFVREQHLTLILDDAQASFPMAQMVARAINQELADPAVGGVYERGADGELTIRKDLAMAVSPQEVRVLIPSYELAEPASFISQILQTPIFTLPKQQARVTINRRTNHVVMTGAVTILPTVVQIPGLGTLAVGDQTGGGGGAVGLSTEEDRSIEFQQLLQTLQQLQLDAAQTVSVIEQLHAAGTLQAQLTYTE